MLLAHQAHKGSREGQVVWCCSISTKKPRSPSLTPSLVEWREEPEGKQQKLMGWNMNSVTE